MYLELEEGKDILSHDKLWYSGETSKIYKNENLLYKIYLKNEPNRRAVLDKLISTTTIRDIGILPIQKIRTDLGKYGAVTRFMPKTLTFYQYSKKDYDIDEIINIFIMLSDSLKRINKENIKFSDLHHNNILIDRDNKPWYIDFDDAVVDDYSSNHISV